MSASRLARVADDAGEFRDGRGVVEVAVLRGGGQLVVRVHQQDEHAPPLRGKLQAAGDLLGQHCAGVLVVAGVGRLAGVVQQQGEIKHGGVFQLLEKRAVAAEAFLFGEEDAVEFLDADEGVFVGGVTVIKLVLHQAGERAELRNIASEEAEIVHFAQDAPDLALAGKDGEEGLAGHAGILKSAVDQTQACGGWCRASSELKTNCRIWA